MKPFFKFIIFQFFDIQETLPILICISTLYIYLQMLQMRKVSQLLCRLCKIRSGMVGWISLSTMLLSGNRPLQEHYLLPRKTTWWRCMKPMWLDHLPLQRLVCSLQRWEVQILCYIKRIFRYLCYIWAFPFLRTMYFHFPDSYTNISTFYSLHYIFETGSFL